MMFAFCTILSIAHAAYLVEMPHKIENQYIIVLDTFGDPSADLTNKMVQERVVKRQHDILENHLEYMYELTAALPRRRTVHGESSAFELGWKFEDIPNFTGYSATLSKEALWIVMNDPMVEYVEEDAILEASWAEEWNAPDEDARFYDEDARFVETRSCSRQSSAQWHLVATNAGRATTSTTTFRHPSNGGQGVDIYILDTGIRRSHQDFGGRASWGFDAFTSNPHRTDRNGHGTHVASSAGGARWGVAKRANLIDVRVLGDDGRGSSSGYAAGLNWAVARARSRGRTAVMNASLEFNSGSGTVDRATTSAANHLLCVVAAGNGGTNSCNISPARASGALTVGNAQRNNQRRGSSNYGDCTHIFGPGTDIVAASHRDDRSTRTLTGTSMAAPHVAGVAALYLAENPGQSASALRRQVISTARSGSVSDARGPNLYVRKSC
jgi:subtilisin family serine protease